MTTPDLLAYYRGNRAIIDILADSRALFVLGLADHLRHVTVAQLREHSGWEEAVFAEAFAKLLDNRMVSREDRSDTDSVVHVLSGGADALKLLYNLRDQSRIELSTSPEPFGGVRWLPEDQARRAITVLQSDADEALKNQAFETLYAAYNRNVWAYVRSRSRNFADADDIALDAWERILRGIPRFQPYRGPFLAYARLLAGHAAIDWYRHQNRHGYANLLRAEVEEFAEETNVTDWDTGDQWRLDSRRGIAPDAEHQAALVAVTTLLRQTFEADVAPQALVVFGLIRLLKLKPREISWAMFDGGLRGPRCWQEIAWLARRGFESITAGKVDVMLRRWTDTVMKLGAKVSR